MPFKRFVDFDATDHRETSNEAYFCAEEAFPMSKVPAQRPKVLEVPYTNHLGPMLVVIRHTYGTMLQTLTPEKYNKTRTITVPQQFGTTSSLREATAKEIPRELSRNALRKLNHDVVEVKLRSRYQDGEWLKWEKRFPGNVKLRETCHWMLEVASRERDMITGVQEWDELTVARGHR